MIIKPFHISIEAGEYRSGLKAVAIDDQLILKSDLGEWPEAHIRLSRNPEWAKLVGRIRADIPDTTTVTVSLPEEEYETRFRRVTDLVVYHAAGDVHLYTHGEIAPGSYDMERRLCIRVLHFGEPYLEK